jgi:hypothetical protein
MKRYVIAILLLMVVGTLSGCIQNDTVIHVNPDGSGTIQETVLYSNTMLDFMVSMAKMEESADKDERSTEKSSAENKDRNRREIGKTRDDVINELGNDADKQVKQFGGAVTFVSSKPVKTETAGGYTAIYAFKDINLVRVNQNPGGKVDAQKSEKGESSRKEETISFTFVKGSPSLLVVSAPELKGFDGDKAGTDNKSKAADDQQAKPPEKEHLEMMKAMFQDMKLRMALNIGGNIVRTNATYRDGSTLTLMEIDFGKVVSDYDLLKKMSKAKPQSIEETKALLKGIAGFKMELNYPVTVEFN